MLWDYSHGGNDGKGHLNEEKKLKEKKIYYARVIASLTSSVECSLTLISADALKVPPLTFPFSTLVALAKIVAHTFCQP